MTTLMKRFFLVDCNNFFVSCERVFNPKLIGKPVVILSSNDACIIARSQEAKKLGIKMGEPLYACKDLILRHKVEVFSSNFPLYADMSDRVMKTIAQYASDIEIYSVDEAFLHYDLPTIPHNAPNFYLHYGHLLRSKVKQHVGIPVSIGIGPTKTLAKVANKLAKDNPTHQGVFDITQHPQICDILQQFPVEDIWGIGYRYARLLKGKGVHHAYDLVNMDDRWIRKNMTIQGLKTVNELRGIPTLQLEQVRTTRQSLCVSRLFGKPVTEKNILKQAASSHVSTAAAKLRRQQSVARVITIFTCWVTHHDSQRHYASHTLYLRQSTHYTPQLIRVANACIDALYQSGKIYKKIGVIVTDISSDQQVQLPIENSFHSLEKEQALMRTIDSINKKMGASKVFFASSGTNRLWKAKMERKSPSYTTQWPEILNVSI